MSGSDEKPPEIRRRGKPPAKPFQKGNKLGRKFPPGVSANPGGRPKNQAESAAYIARRLREEFLDQIVDAIKYHAVKGAAPYMQEAVNRVAGKVKDEIEVSGKDGEPIKIGVVVLPPEDK